MKKTFLILLPALVLFTAGATFAQGPGMMGGYYGEGYGMGPGMMGGYGGGYGMGQGMMGGYGGGYGMGPGMMGPGWRGRGWANQSEDCQKFLSDTAAMRKDLANKRFEYFETLRNPKTTADQAAKMEKEIWELQRNIYSKAPQACW